MKKLIVDMKKYIITIFILFAFNLSFSQNAKYQRVSVDTLKALNTTVKKVYLKDTIIGLEIQQVQKDTTKYGVLGIDKATGKFVKLWNPISNSDTSFWLNPIDEFAAYQSCTVEGKRVIATSTTSGWIKDYIYECIGSSWIETTPLVGNAIYCKTDSSIYTKNFANWTKISGLDTTLFLQTAHDWDNVNTFPSISADSVNVDRLCVKDSTSIDIHHHGVNSVLTFSNAASKLVSMNMYNNITYHGFDIGTGNYVKNGAWYRSAHGNPQCQYFDIDNAYTSWWWGGHGAIGSTITWTAPKIWFDSLGTGNFQYIKQFNKTSSTSDSIVVRDGNSLKYRLASSIVPVIDTSYANGSVATYYNLQSKADTSAAALLATQNTFAKQITFSKSPVLNDLDSSATAADSVLCIDNTSKLVKTRATKPITDYIDSSKVAILDQANIFTNLNTFTNGNTGFISTGDSSIVYLTQNDTTFKIKAVNNGGLQITQNNVERFAITPDGFVKIPASKLDAEPCHAYFAKTDTVATTVTIGTRNLYKKLLLTYAVSEMVNFSLTSDTIKYLGTKPAHLHISVNFNATSSSSLDYWVRITNLTDNAVLQTTMFSTTGTSDYKDVTMQAYDLNCNPNDKYLITIKNKSSTTDISVFNFSAFYQITHFE